MTEGELDSVSDVVNLWKAEEVEGLRALIGGAVEPEAVPAEPQPAIDLPDESTA
jgi:hypothetical protein